MRRDAEFREIFVLSCGKGWSAIRDEAEGQLRGRPELLGGFAEKLSALPGHAERAMVASCIQARRRIPAGRVWLVSLPPARFIFRDKLRLSSGQPLVPNEQV